MATKRFENFRKASTKSKRNICWTCILRFLEKNNFDIDLKGVEQVSDFLIDILMKYDCSNKIIFYKILEFYFRCHFHACDKHYKGAKMEYMHLFFKPFRCTQRNSHLLKVDVGILSKCTPNAQFMLILSKYGILGGCSFFDISSARRILKNFLLYFQGDDESLLYASEEYKKIEAFCILEDMRKSQGQMPYSTNQRGMRYVYLMVKTLHIIYDALKGNPTFCTTIKCLRVFFRTVPDPFVSQEDMKEFLQVIWTVLKFKVDDLAIVTDIYERLFEKESPRIYTPRSLKHLCRVSLRHILAKKSKMLPYCVRRLPIPRDLHDYLLCIEPITVY